MPEVTEQQPTGTSEAPQESIQEFYARREREKYPERFRNAPDAPAEPENPEPEPAPASEPADSQERPAAQPQVKEEPVTPGVQKRIDKAVAQQRQAERERDELKARIAAMEQGPRPAPATTQPEKPAPAATEPSGSSDPRDPKPTDKLNPATQKPWQNWNEYQDAKDAWLVREGTRRAQATMQQQRLAEQMEQKWTDAMHEAAESPGFEDIDEVLTAATDIKVPPAIAQAALLSPEGPKILYQIAKDPDLAKSLLKLSPFDQVRAFAALEAELPKADAAPKPQPVSKAPRPPARVARGTAPVPFDFKDPNTDFLDWERRRKAQIRARR